MCKGPRHRKNSEGLRAGEKGVYGHTVVGGVVTGGLEKEIQSQNPKGLVAH